ncbi:MAG: FtsW/RodA/SpoVE family cell cycle protein [Lachnospiraceae bacterium]
MLPVTGIPLPFFSYGGSNMLSCMIAVAIVLNVNMRRLRYTTLQGI